MKIIDNFLEPFDFKTIQNTLMNPHFPWYYQDHSTNEGDSISQLTHVFYNFDLIQKSNGPNLNILEPLFKKINAVGLVRVKANLNFPCKRTEKFHTDFSFKNLLTAIYYVNTNDGGTRFKNKTVQSVENRIVIMPSDTLHAVVRHTDPSFGRFVININYFEGKSKEGGRGKIEE
jgi:hypothetical protein